MSPGKNIPLEFGPLAKDSENFTDQIITAYFCGGGRHSESPYQYILVLFPAGETRIHTGHFIQKIVQEPQRRESPVEREAEGIPPSSPAAGVNRGKKRSFFSLLPNYL
jgi:hypothetical protein